MHRYTLVRFLAVVATVAGAFPASARIASANPTAGSIDSRQAACLARNVYFEARGESVEGMVAVGKVAMNRSADDGRDLCSVIYERSDKGCQFSWVCHGRSVIREDGAWRRAEAVARALVSEPVQDPTAGSTGFHRCELSPRWVDYRFVRRIGAHCFYRRLDEGTAQLRAANYAIVEDDSSPDGFALTSSLLPGARVPGQAAAIRHLFISPSTRLRLALAHIHKTFVVPGLWHPVFLVDNGQPQVD